MTAKRDSTTVLWQVQVRLSRAHAWRSKGLFETRRNARFHAQWMRDGIIVNDKTGRQDGPYGFGNTRVVRFEKKGRK